MQHEESDFTLILVQRRIVVFLEGGHAEMQTVEAGAAIIVDLWGYEYVMKNAVRKESGGDFSRLFRLLPQLWTASLSEPVGGTSLRGCPAIASNRVQHQLGRIIPLTSLNLRNL